MTSQEKFDDSMKKTEQDIAEKKARVLSIIESTDDLTDDDGYPTEEALEVVEKWHWDDAKGWFKFIEGLWAYHDFGWKEKDEPHELQGFKGYENRMSHRYHISTAGWSGNESIIHAMKRNEMMWHLNWVQSRRGGHYIFELREFI